jgi:biotin carboxylase
MRYTALRFTLAIALIGVWNAASTLIWAEDDAAALAAALKDTTTTLQGGLKASEREGTPISAKFEIEKGKLQLSVYTMKDDGFTEVVADPKTGAVTEAEKITDADGLKAAASQKAAMAKAKVPLLAATEKAVKANSGSRAVSVFPQLQNGVQ